MRAYRSIDEARRAFQKLAANEPRLLPLWDLCGRAAPQLRVPDFVDDVYDYDPFEIDPLAADSPEAGWCAEDYFRDHVKSKLLLLAGLHRPGPPHELHEREAFEEVYDLLLNWALHRPCPCCVTREDTARRHSGSPAHP